MERAQHDYMHLNHCTGIQVRKWPFAMKNTIDRDCREEEGLLVVFALQILRHFRD
jgi:hypothetical protein